MIVVSVYEREGRSHCIMTTGRLSVESDGASFPAAFIRTYLKLTFRRLTAVFVRPKLLDTSSPLMIEKRCSEKDDC